MEDHKFEPPNPASEVAQRDPYEDIDVSTLPTWWQEAIREFEEHGVPPYRPPRFADGTLKYEVVEPLEAEFSVEVDFIGINVVPGDRWTVRVDSEPVGTIERKRSAGRYTVFNMDADEFESWLRKRLD